MKAYPTRATHHRGGPGFALVLLFSLLVVSRAGGQIAADTPIEFFTNVASRLLQAQLGMKLINIEVYPTNQYTPAVHRLLQVTANLYEATTNRAFVTNLAEPYCPTMYRPLFRRTPDGRVVIAGYREVTGIGMASATTAPPMLGLEDDPGETNLVPVIGRPFAPADGDEPMVWGIPLVIGARKGFPNFNEFSMQTAISVSRLLEFRRAAGDNVGPVVQTNLMYTLGVSNIFGLEAWNSYTNPYPRNLQLEASVYMTAMLTNEAGDVLVSNQVASTFLAVSNAGTWPGWTSAGNVGASLSLPWGSTSGFAFLNNSSYVSRPPSFVPVNHTFEQGAGLYVTHWWLSLKSHVLFILVDTDANRIVDYVNLSQSSPIVDLFGTLAAEADCSGNPAGLVNPACQWCTNLFGTGGLPVGVANQIELGLGAIPGNPPPLPNTSYSLDPYSGLDAESAIDGFRYNLMWWSPVYPKDQGKIFYKSNVFYVPFDPFQPIYIHSTLQANDPLVHYTLGDLTLMAPGSNTVDFLSHNPPLDNLGYVNQRYQPWGNSGPSGSSSPSVAPMDLGAKDPLIMRSDCWDFPTNQALGVGWVGRVHRGTPWQTLYLKSSNVLLETGNTFRGLFNWETWTGDGLASPIPGRNSFSYPDAWYTVPTNDWQIAGLLVAWFTTNDVHNLASPNQTTVSAWTALLDGMTVLTNVSSTELDPLVMSANSPQAAAIAAGLLATRATEPGQVFLSPGDILATPELSVNSPWLSTNSTATDQAYEIIPSQLLPLLRADWLGSVTAEGNQLQIQFTGFDGYPYAVQVSSNLANWSAVSTNYTTNGMFSIPIQPDPAASVRYYRSKLGP